MFQKSGLSEGVREILCAAISPEPSKRNRAASRDRVKRAASAVAEVLESRCLLSTAVLPANDNIPFKQIVIDQNPGTVPVVKVLGDLTNSGKLDAIIGHETTLHGGGLFWYQFPSSGNPSDTWNKYTIDATADCYEQGAVADISGHVDSHGNPVNDVIMCERGTVYWYENPLGDGINPTTVSSWTKHVIGSISQGATHEMYLADLDGDGKMDVVTSDAIFFQNAPTTPGGFPTWTEVANPTYNRTQKGLYLFNSGSGLGAVDLLGTGEGPGFQVGWYENPRDTGGNARTDTWVFHPVGPTYTNYTDGGGISYGAMDVNGDGHEDIITCDGETPNTAPEGGLIWWQSPANPATGTWTEHPIDASLDDVHNIVIGDMNGDGTPEILAFEQDQSVLGRLMIVYNEGGTGQNWLEQTLVSDANPALGGGEGGQNEKVGDIDGDGNLDILTAPHGYYTQVNPISVYMNQLNADGIVRPTVTSPPGSKSVNAGASVTFSVSATGTGPLTYQWELNGLDISGATSSSYTIGSVPLSDNNDMFRCIVGNPGGLIPSAAATLSVSQGTPTAPAIASNPGNQNITAGQTASFTAAASGNPTPAVQWQVSSGGGPFANITNNASATTTTLSLPGVGTAMSGNQYRAVFSNGVGSPATTTAGTLTVNPAPPGPFIDSGGPAVGSYVADTDFSGGSTYSTTSSINTSADATGAPASVYQSERYGNFTYTVPNLVAGSSYSVLLHFAEIYWTSAGQRLFNVSINGTQVLSSFDIFAAAGGADKAIVESFNATADTNGEITIVFTSVKDNAKVSAIDVVPTSVTPTAPAITTNPQNKSVTAGQSVSFTAAASGSPTPTVQWQVSSGGGAFANITGNASATTTTLTLTGVGTALNGNQYEAVFTNGVGSPATTNAATLMVNAATTGTFIDSGGPAVGSYVADTDFSGGSTYSTTNSINTSADATGAPASVYQTERWGNFTYTVPNLVAGSSYSVLLHFAEIYWNSAGQRLFNVSINGTQVLSSFDIFAAAGGADKAIVESFNATADTNGEITIVFTSVKDNAKVSAIDVVPTSVTPTAPAITSNPQNKSVTAGQSVSFTAAASGSPTPTVQWQVSSGGGAFTNITGNASATTTTLTLTGVGTALNGNQYQAVFTNGVGSPATTNAAMLMVNAATTGAFIDSGGPAVGSYVADTDFSGGSTTYSTTNSIDTSADPTGAPASVYQTERYGNFTYTVPNLVAGSSYSVLLHFAEIYWTSAGQRLFNVSINGTQVLSSFDIFAAAGGADKAIVESFNATADTNGNITIVFTSVENNAKVSAIDVIPA